MDDRTAYEILKIKAGTSLNDIVKRHDHFSRLYKHYQMGERVYISPEKLEQMKSAYECLLYKRIEDEELQYLYPLESNSRCYQTYDKIICPLMKRHKPKIIYTIVMSVLTIIIICVINYKPVDFQVTVYLQPSETVYEYESRIMNLDAYEYEMLGSLPGIKKPRIDYQNYYPANGAGANLLGLYTADDVDVYIMEEALLSELQEKAIEFYNVGSDTAKVYVNKKTSLYRNICNAKNENRSWVAVVSPLSRRKEQAMNFITRICSSD